MNNSFKITLENLKKQINVAMKRKEADLIFKNAKYVNVFLESIETADIVIADGVVVAFGKPGEYKGKVELVTGEGDRLNLKSNLAKYVSLATIFSGNSDIEELELVAYDPEDVKKLLEFAMG